MSAQVLDLASFLKPAPVPAAPAPSDPDEPNTNQVERALGIGCHPRVIHALDASEDRIIALEARVAALSAAQLALVETLVDRGIRAILAEMREAPS